MQAITVSDYHTARDMRILFGKLPHKSNKSWIIAIMYDRVTNEAMS